MSISITIERLRTKIKNRGISLLPPLTATYISNFEKSNAITLPPDYQEFLLHIGNGGIGPPAYNLCALGTTPSDLDFATVDLSKPFPFTQPWIWEDGAISSEGREEDVYCGVLILGTDGCALYWALVVRGPDFGKIWTLADVGIGPVIPKVTFVEWYEAWLDRKGTW